MSISSELQQKINFSWQVLDVIIGGQSAIDSSHGLNLKTPEEIEKFLESYGFDLSNPIEKAELFGNYQESLQFVKTHFLKPGNTDGLDIEIPRKLLELTDIVQIFIYASQYDSTLTAKKIADEIEKNQSMLLAMWSCALLKVMHTIAHMDRDLGASTFSDVQKQILDKFYRYIQSDQSGQIFLGKDARDLDRVDLVMFESKPKKSRESVIIKLLHKPENVAEEIFDRVGIRFVAKSKYDALRILKYLKERFVIMSANIKPSRSRNTMINIKEFKKGLEEILKQVESGNLKEDLVYQKLVTLCEDAVPDEFKDRDNPHTSNNFRSIQFTGRNLIKLKNPLYDDIKTLKLAVKGKTVPEEILSITDRIDLKNIQKEVRFFYPFEVQIYDHESYQQSLKGMSSHIEYKKSQLKTAMKRVMGPLCLLKSMRDEK